MESKQVPDLSLEAVAMALGAKDIRIMQLENRIKQLEDELARRQSVTPAGTSETG